MSFTLHTSNKTENLLEHLALVLAQPLPSPFDPDIFLIQSPGMERWLLQQLSHKFGVMANYQLLLPNRFFNEIAQAVCPDRDLKPTAFSRERLVWTVDAVLRDWVTASPDGFDEVRRYLQGEQAAKKRFQLAQQLTQLFDQYQVFRPAWMDETSPSHWSLKVWRAVLQKLGETHHIGQAWQFLIEALQSPSLSSAHGLPKRISVFGIHAMPVVFVQVLQALSKHTDVHLYVTQPTDGYWADLRSRAEVKRDKVMGVFVDTVPQAAEATNHPLLSLLGQQGRDFHQLLVEHADFDWEFDSFEEEADTALAQLQTSIRENRATGRVALTDASIQCVSCHSRMREMQVLKDFLLKTLQDDPSLQLRDLVVMAPNIADYEPFIETVFREARLPFAIADKSTRDGNEVYDALVALLQMLGGRFEWPVVMDLLERSPIRQRLTLADRDLDQLQSWIEQTHTRWGRSAEHKAQLGLPSLVQNTWDAGLRQMMLGFAMQDQTVSIEGAQGQLLAKLDVFVRRVLFHYAESSVRERSPQAWREWLMGLIETLFDVQSPDVQGLYHTLEILAEVDTTETYDLASLLAWLDESVAEQKSAQGFMAGQLTFCSMLPMRSIPFKVVAVLGLNEGEFPRQDRRPSFDLMADDFQLGDRSTRVDDRYQFLELILSARQTLYLSYIGQSQKKPQDIPPSVVLQELLDELAYDESHFPLKHPLQAFSVEYFRADSGLQTFDAAAQQTAQALQQKTLSQPLWFQDGQPLPGYEGSVIDLADFLFFAGEPQKWFVQKRLGLRLSEVEAEMAAHESFEVAGLERYHIEQNILQALCRGESVEAVKADVIASGQWPSGAMGAITLDDTLPQIADMVEAIAALQLGARQAPEWLSVPINGFRLEGSLSQGYEQGFLRARYAKLKPKDFIQAALTQALTGQNVHLLGLNDKRELQQVALTATTPLSLDAWVECYVRAHQAPTPYWPQLGWAYLTSFNDKKAPKGSKGKPEEEVEQMRRDAARQAAHKVFKDAREKSDYNNRTDETIIRLTQGRDFDAIWSEHAQSATLALLEPIHALFQDDQGDGL